MDLSAQQLGGGPSMSPPGANMFFMPGMPQPGGMAGMNPFAMPPTREHGGAESSGGSDDDDDGEGRGRAAPKRAGRRKIEIAFIDDKSRRHITFSKRKGGIIKKAQELSILTGTQMLLMIASETGHLYSYATAKFKPLMNQAKVWFQANVNTDSPDEPDLSALGAAGPNEMSEVSSTSRKAKRPRKESYEQPAAPPNPYVMDPAMFGAAAAAQGSGSGPAQMSSLQMQQMQQTMGMWQQQLLHQYLMHQYMQYHQQALAEEQQQEADAAAGAGGEDKGKDDAHEQGASEGGGWSDPSRPCRVDDLAAAAMEAQQAEETGPGANVDVNAVLADAAAAWMAAAAAASQPAGSGE